MRRSLETRRRTTGFANPSRLEASAPLWQRLPTSDEQGRPLCDFMMILPKLRDKPMVYVQSKIMQIQQVLDRFSEYVVFADYNIKLNVLMVVLKRGHGTCWAIPSAINERVPEALLVAQPRF